MINNIKLKSIKSLKWVALGNILNKMFTPIISLYIAAIVGPEAYGLVAISAAFIGYGNLLQGFGVKDYVVKEDINEKILNSSFWFNIFIAISLFLFFLLITPYVSSLYNEPLL